MFLLSAENVSKIYRAGTRQEVRAVDDVSLSVGQGGCVLLTGPSGSGKTTLLALLGALARPTAGRVTLQGRDLAGASDVELARARRRLGFVFQNFSLLPRLPVWENVTYGLIPRGVTRDARLRLAEEQLERLGLASKLGERPEVLSGGEQQRVAVARALVTNPEILMADEPTSNLDQRSAEELIALFGRLHSEGHTLIVATHDPRFEPLATEVFRMDRGRLV